MDTKVPRKFQPKITPYNSAPKSSLAPSILQFCKYRSAKEIQEELTRVRNREEIERYAPNAKQIITKRYTENLLNNIVDTLTKAFR